MKRLTVILGVLCVFSSSLHAGEKTRKVAGQVAAPTNPAQPAQSIGLFCTVGHYAQKPETVDAALPAPQLLAPADGAVFDHYPRYTTLVWSPVPGADGYCVESDDGFDKSWRSVEHPDYPPVLYHTFIPTYTFDFVGAQPGRWRVWAVDAEGNPGRRSEWREFRYTR